MAKSTIIKCVVDKFRPIRRAKTDPGVQNRDAAGFLCEKRASKIVMKFREMQLAEMHQPDRRKLHLNNTNTYGRAVCINTR
jgi:hypothetical protein